MRPEDLPDRLFRTGGNGNPAIGHLDEDCVGIRETSNVGTVSLEYLRRAPGGRLCRRCGDGRVLDEGDDLPAEVYIVASSAHGTIAHVERNCGVLRTARSVLRVSTETVRQAGEVRICRRCGDGREFNGGGESR